MPASSPLAALTDARLDPNDLLLFAAVVQAGSLTAAANRLDQPKATVSRRLSHLEAQLGQKLLIRTTRRLALTEFGEGLLDHCQRLGEALGAATDFARARQDQPRGRLRVSMPSDFAQLVLNHAIATFTQTWSQVQLELDLTPQRVDLIGERFDLAIRITQSLPDDSTLVATRLSDLHWGLYASPIYLATHGAPAHPQDLLNHQALRMLTRQGPQAWTLLHADSHALGAHTHDASIERWEQTPPGRLAVNSPGMLLQLAYDGAGIAALPQNFPDIIACNQPASARLQRVLPQWCLPPSTVWAVTATRKYLPAKTRAFIEHCRQALQT